MKIAFTIVGLIVIGLGGFYFLSSDPEPTVEDLADTDTGFTRHETEERLRRIGYVQ